MERGLTFLPGDTGQGHPPAARIAGVDARGEPGFRMHTHQHKRVSTAPRSVRVHVRGWRDDIMGERGMARYEKLSHRG